MSTAPKDFPRAWDLLLLAAVNGWDVSWAPGVDAGGSPYVTVRAVRGRTKHLVTWHTRRDDGLTGSPHMTSAMTNTVPIGWRDVTLTKVRSDITREAS